MARYKVLKSVAHNVGHSFTSLMNYWHDDYVMGHILRFSRESRLDSVTIDLVSGEGSPEALLREPIAQIPEYYSSRFHTMVVNSGSSISLIQNASLTVSYDLTKTFTILGSPQQNPYTCDVLIVDDRGREYRAHFEGSWYVEKTEIKESVFLWWNPISWIRHS